MKFCEASAVTILFGDPQGIDCSLVSDKGAELGCPDGAALNEPSGYVVDTKAHVMRMQGLKKTVSHVRSAVDDENPVQLEECMHRIRERKCEEVMHSQVSREIARAYQGIGESYFGMRSADPSEDIKVVSFAGLHDTSLDICSIESLPEAVKQCCASHRAERANLNLNSQVFDHFTPSIALGGDADIVKLHEKDAVESKEEKTVA